MSGEGSKESMRRSLVKDDNEDVRRYWNQEACGTARPIVGEVPELSREWFERIESYRYDLEPFIHSVAQFTRHHGQRMLEIGVGAGTDHLQWARAGLECHGVDLTERAIEVTRTRLALYGLTSHLQRIDAEILPFPDQSFDLVYSWGVIHHAEHPERIIAEVRRVLKPNGLFIGMLYGRHSLVALKLWVKYGVLRGRPDRTLAHVVAHHMESPGTKAYTIREVRELYAQFSQVTATPVLTPYDRLRLPAWLTQWLPARWGWFICIHAVK